MSEVKLDRGYWTYGKTSVPISATIEDINNLIRDYSTQVGNLTAIRDRIEESEDLRKAVEAQKQSSGEYQFHGDRFIEGYMAALKEQDGA